MEQLGPQIVSDHPHRNHQRISSHKRPQNQKREKAVPAHQSHHAAPQYASSTSSSQTSAPPLRAPQKSLKTDVSAKVTTTQFTPPIYNLTRLPPARTHPPSEYTPLCNSCGLILCTLHAPHRPCPHCIAPLLDASARNALLVQLDEQRAHVLAEEALERQRAAEALRKAEGAFPALGGGGAPKGAGGGVLSFDRQTKRVRVEAYRVKEEVDREEALLRVPPPISVKEVQYLRLPRGPATRWAVLMGGKSGAKYVAPPS